MDFKGKKGVSLVETTVALVVLGGVFLGSLSFLRNQSKATRTLASQSSIEMLRRAISSQIDCYDTLETPGIDPTAPGASCQSTSAPNGQQPPYLRLARLTSDNATAWLSSSLAGDGSALINGWYVRASCSQSEGTLVIRAAKADGMTADFYGRDSLLFGDAARGAIPVCFHNAAPPFTAGCQLTAAPAVLIAGGTTTLNLVPSGDIEKASIDGTTVAATGGSVTRTPASTITYTAKVAGRGGYSSCQTTVTVNPAAPPAAPTCTLTANPSTAYGVNTPVPVTLTLVPSGSVTGASIDGTTIPAAGGSVARNVTVTKTFIGTVTGTGGTRNCNVTVPYGPKPARVTFSVFGSKPGTPIYVGELNICFNYKVGKITFSHLSGGTNHVSATTQVRELWTRVQYSPTSASVLSNPGSKVANLGADLVLLLPGAWGAAIGSTNLNQAVAGSLPGGGASSPAFTLYHFNASSPGTQINDKPKGAAMYEPYTQTDSVCIKLHRPDTDNGWEYFAGYYDLIY